jgi:DNA-binding response OmpR family regulator
LRILLVEHSERLRRTLTTAFRHAGYATDATGDGAEGLWLAQSSDYDLIVLDLMLPNVDGLTILSRLREAGKDTHVLLLTAKDGVEDRVRGLRHGADDYLVKPFALDELLARVEALVRRRHGAKQSEAEQAGGEELRDVVSALVEMAVCYVPRHSVLPAVPSHGAVEGDICRPKQSCPDSSEQAGRCRRGSRRRC